MFVEGNMFVCVPSMVYLFTFFISQSSMFVHCSIHGLECSVFLHWGGMCFTLSINNNNNNIFILYSAKSIYSSKRFTIKRCEIASLKLIRNVKCVIP